MTPNKIVSLVPSLTELLFDLGLADRVVGRTRFCIHPEESINDIPIVGGTKNPNLDKIRNLSPDLIIANREENRKEDIEELQEDGYNVMVTEVSTIEEALFVIHDIGWTCGVQTEAKNLIQNIQDELAATKTYPETTAAYLIWRDPWMSIGYDTYIHSVMEHYNLQNVFSRTTRYPKTTLHEISLKKPSVILLSSEPYPFKEKHIKEVGDVCSGSDILLVNGEWFSWYGSRMLQSFQKLNAFRKIL
jgi:ABC-type Fe3+-hydroxamate transport system substrate-binding protein